MNKTTKRLIKLFIILFFFVVVFILITQKSLLFPQHMEVFPLLKKESIRKVIVSEDKNKSTVEKKNTQWMIGDFLADAVRIDQILDMITTLKKDDIASQNKKKYADFGVDGGKKIEFDTHVIYVGDGKGGTSYHYFRVDTDPIVYRTASDFSSLLTIEDLKDLNTHFINKEDAVEYVNLSWGSTNLESVKKNNEWTVNGKKAFKERVDFFINDIKTLKGDEIFKKETIDFATLPVELSIAIKESGKTKKSIVYRKDAPSKEDIIYYFYQKDSTFVYKIPSSYVASLKKEEKDMIK